MLKSFRIFIFFTFLANFSAMASEDNLKSKPLFEYGFFIGGLTIADYPASDQSRLRTLPLPVVRYHGDLFRSDDEDGTRFRMINNDKIDFDLSFGGSFPTETGNNQARIGMPTLDWTAEIGPRLLYYLYRDKKVAQIRIGIPLRMTFTTNFITWSNIGYVFAPTFQIDKYNFLVDDLNLYFNFTWNYLDAGVANYFYRIDPVYATSERASYEARSGTLGYDLDLALKYQWSKKTIILATRYSNFSESANSKSFLHRSNTNWTIFSGISWIIGESELAVPVKYE